MAIRKATNDDIQKTCDLLFQAFKPYRRQYTEEGYKATVLCRAAIRKRLDDKRTSILVAEQDREIVGAASVTVAKGRLHIRSMAVSTRCQRKGIGWKLLQEINRLAKLENLKVIPLECFEPLTEAKSL